MLAELDGSCRTPIAGHAVLVESDVIELRASLLVLMECSALMFKAEVIMQVC